MNRGHFPLRGVGESWRFLPAKGNTGKALVKPELTFLSLLKDGTTALLKAAIKGYNNVIEELLKFSPTLGLLKVSSETYRFQAETPESKGSDERSGIYGCISGR